MAKKKQAQNEALPVKFGNVNVGDETASLRCEASRANLTVEDADRKLCGKRLAGTATARSTGQAGQESLPGMNDDAVVTGIFDIGSFTATPKAIKFGLTFSLASFDVTTLARFAKREGLLKIADSAAIPEKEQQKLEEEEDKSNG